MHSCGGVNTVPGSVRSATRASILRRFRPLMSNDSDTYSLSVWAKDQEILEKAKSTLVKVHAAPGACNLCLMSPVLHS